MTKEKTGHADMGSLTDKPTILIAEDHPMISIMLADMIDQLVTHSEIIVVESMEKARAIRAEPDLVIADLDLPDSKGVGTINTFAVLFPQCPKLICSGVLDKNLAREAERAGYFYVNKASTYPELLRALQNLLIQAGVLDDVPKGAEKAANEYHSNIYAPGSDKPLTWKQVEIMRKTAEGLSAKEVAREMDISRIRCVGTSRKYSCAWVQKTKVRLLIFSFGLNAKRACSILEHRWLGGQDDPFDAFLTCLFRGPVCLGIHRYSGGRRFKRHHQQRGSNCLAYHAQQRCRCCSGQLGQGRWFFGQPGCAN
ncbi:hypothetical protein BSZ31_04805 [Limnobacter sp. SAORIC-690]|uniref:response regulator transcription factor n=1 Tax=Limnobacter sp. SAORIC-690 TaxID=1923970 RepID=UPI000CF4D3CA|nr:response regulator transcription factor [Limnobacter sp. SAORIC-690]PQJ24387.1 hypothetical protein BSZ31_04805 [Limnobacter sp. SAORIC-690]